MTAKQIRFMLFRKEMRLALQPATVFFMALSLMMLIPEYPYLITFFYATLGVFFICVFGRENHDVEYTALLPVDRRAIVQARFDLCICTELAMMALSAAAASLRPSMGLLSNAAGMVPNAAMFGFAAILLGAFNIVFFPMYYKNTQKIGVPYTIGAIVFSIGMIAVMAGTMIPDSPMIALDGYAPEHAAQRTVTFLCGMLCFVLLTWLAFRISVKRFERDDI